jgi:hypothetical protein
MSCQLSGSLSSLEKVAPVGEWGISKKIKLYDLDRSFNPLIQLN